MWCVPRRYCVTKQFAHESGQRSLLFQIEYPEIEDGKAPRHRFMSSIEQKVEPWDKRYQYLLFAADPYEVSITAPPLSRQTAAFESIPSMCQVSSGWSAVATELKTKELMKRYGAKGENRFVRLGQGKGAGSRASGSVLLACQLTKGAFDR
jgi:hypothetical protein